MPDGDARHRELVIRGNRARDQAHQALANRFPIEYQRLLCRARYEIDQERGPLPIREKKR